MTKRTAFFSNETVQALRILVLDRMTREQLRGSWAGAMGNMQFMPSTFMKWGVDRDGHGKIDLWTSLPDSFASAANYLRGVGFKPGLPSSEEVFLPQGFPLDQADTTIEKPVRAWAAMGVKRAGNAALPNVDDPSSIILPAGWRGPAFILYPNFKAVMNWNRSTLYALAVGILARQIVGGPPVMQAAPADDEPLSRDTIIDLQSRLAKLGLYTDENDGLLGPKTRSAVRLFQKQAGLPADGHPTPDVVRRLQQTAR
jgi:membrane-bound lytic murein transglycosylase B